MNVHLHTWLRDNQANVAHSELEFPACFVVNDCRFSLYMSGRLLCICKRAPPGFLT